LSRAQTLQELLNHFLEEPRDQSRWSYVVDRALSQPRISGEPAAIRRVGSVFQQGSAGADQVRTDLSTVAVKTLPAIWSGWAAADAVTVASVAASGADRTSITFSQVGSTLHKFASALEKAIARYEQGRWDLNEAIRAAEYPDTGRYEHVTTLIGDGLRAMLDGATQAESAARVTARSLGEDAERTRAGRMRNPALTAIDSLMLAEARDDGGPILSPDAAARADMALDALSSADRARFDQLLSGCVSAEERAYLLKALSNRRSIDDIAAFDADIRANAANQAWLAKHLHTTLSGRFLELNEVRVRQPDETTCGSTALMALRIDSDPIYALSLSLGQPPDDSGEAVKQRLRAEAVAIHHHTTDLDAGWWPESLGTPPGNMKDWVNAHVGFGGYGLEHNVLGAPAAEEMDAVVRAAQHGQPSILLIGDGTIPRHYVMVTGESADEVSVYDPGPGTTKTIPVADLRAGKVDALGFGHLFSVLRQHS
jgi:hypothetical protein